MFTDIHKRQTVVPAISPPNPAGLSLISGKLLQGDTRSTLHSAQNSRNLWTISVWFRPEYLGPPLKVVHFDWFYRSDQMPFPFAKLQKQAKKCMQVKVGFVASDESQVGY